jgi:hypothetical protein
MNYNSKCCPSLSPSFPFKTINLDSGFDFDAIAIQFLVVVGCTARDLHH